MRNLETSFSSLCLLSYERPEFLKDTLKSIKLTTPEPYELIIHDDGSASPTTNKLVVNNSALFGATAILNKIGWNQGQGVSLNRMFNIAKGDPIIKLDADLDYNFNWLSEARQILTENKDVGLLGLLHYYHDPVDSNKTIIEEREDCSIHTHILGSAFAVRRECWEELGPFEEYSDAFAEDYLFQKKVTDSEKWKCALPKGKNLVENLGMGIETSTVVVSENQIQKIHKTPYIINSE